MRLLLIALLSIFFYPAFAQVSVKVLDSASGKPLELATIRFLKSDYTVFTDSEGVFKIIPDEDQAEISYIGYTGKTISITGKPQEILLQQKGFQLPEIVVDFKKHKYTTKTKIKQGAVDEYYGFQFGTEHCTYIKNGGMKPGKITSVGIYLSRMKTYNALDRLLGKDKNCKGCKIDYLASYKITFYEYDKTAGQPGRQLHDRDIIVHPKNKIYKLVVDVDSLGIPLPKDGVCVGVEIINTKYTKPKSTFAFIAPFIGFHYYKGTYKAESWVRYRNEGWKFKDATTRKEKGMNYQSITVDLGIKI